MSTQTPKLLDQIRGILRREHYAIRTENAYVNWIKRFIIFHNKRHPSKIIINYQLMTFVPNFDDKCPLLITRDMI